MSQSVITYCGKQFSALSHHRAVQQVRHFSVFFFSLNQMDVFSSHGQKSALSALIKGIGSLPLHLCTPATVYVLPFDLYRKGRDKKQEEEQRELEMTEK